MDSKLLYLYTTYHKDGHRLGFGIEAELAAAIFRAQQSRNFYGPDCQPVTSKLWEAKEIEVALEEKLGQIQP